MQRKILQIIPATGWRAVYSHEAEGTEPDFEVPIFCFALIEEAVSGEIETRVMPLIMTDFEDEAIADNFIGCVGPGMSKDVAGNLVIDYGKENDRLYKLIRRVKNSCGE